MSTPTQEPPYSRPTDPADRWIGGRTEPGVIRARTRFLYSEPSAGTKLDPGRSRHAFSRGAQLVDSDWPMPEDYRRSLASAIHDAIESFGDDADLEIEIRLAPVQKPSG